MANPMRNWAELKEAPPASSGDTETLLLTCSVGRNTETLVAGT